MGNFSKNTIIVSTNTLLNEINYAIKQLSEYKEEVLRKYKSISGSELVTPIDDPFNDYSDYRAQYGEQAEIAHILFMRIRNYENYLIHEQDELKLIVKYASEIDCNYNDLIRHRINLNFVKEVEKLIEASPLFK